MHGKWKRTHDDSNGTYGCWYMRLKELMQTFQDDQEEDKHQFIRSKIEEFEKEQKDAMENLKKGARAKAGFACEK